MKRRQGVKKEKWECLYKTFPSQIKPGDIICPTCGKGFLVHTSKLMLTSYPIYGVFDCDYCGKTWFQMWDGVLCGEEELERIEKNYDKSRTTS